MPNAKVLSEKQAIVEELTKRIGNATAGVLVDYKGITVLEDTALRRELRAAGIEYTVVKNTLLRFAVDKCNLNEFDSVLNGTTSLATTGPDITGVTMHSVPGWVGDDHCITAEIEGVKAVVDICSSTSAIAGWSAVALLRNLASPVCFY